MVVELAAPCTVGDVAVAKDGLYACVSTNTWRVVESGGGSAPLWHLDAERAIWWALLLIVAFALCAGIVVEGDPWYDHHKDGRLFMLLLFVAAVGIAARIGWLR